MNKNQAKGSSNEDSNKGVVNQAKDDKSADNKGKAQKHSAKDGAVLKDINGKAKKESK